MAVDGLEELPQPEKKEVTPAAPVAKKAAKKAAAKKSAKKAASKKASTSDDRLSVEEVAERLDSGSRHWGTGRDRDTNLANEGYDLDEVRTAVNAARAKRMGVSES